MKTVDRLDSLNGKVASGGRINAYAALRMTILKRDGASSKILASLDKQDREEARPVLAAASKPKKASGKNISKTIQAIRAVRGVSYQ